ncbi:MAG: hypothetical protein ACE5QF_07700 [Thermoplasmata archaeon]
MKSALATAGILLTALLFLPAAMSDDPQIQTRSGTTVIIDTKYFLDTDGDGAGDIRLDFGPATYEPQSGATRPNDGDQITVKGKLTGEGTADAEMDVYGIDMNGDGDADDSGDFWRDSGRPPWVGANPGGKHHGKPSWAGPFGI